MVLAMEIQTGVCWELLEYISCWSSLSGYRCYYKRSACSGRVLIDESSNYKNMMSLWNLAIYVKSCLSWNATQACFLLGQQCKTGHNVILTNRYECICECTLMRNIISNPFTNNSIRALPSGNMLQTYYSPPCCLHVSCKAWQVMCSTVFCYFDIKSHFLRVNFKVFDEHCTSSEETIMDGSLRKKI